MNEVKIATLLVSICAFSASSSAAVLDDVQYLSPRGHAKRKGSVATEWQLSRVTTPPLIDGQLSDLCWQAASSRLGAFHIGLSSVPAKHYRQAWAAYDDSHLFFAVKLQREPGKALRALTHEPDNAHIWKDDEIELFLDPFGTGTDYFQLIINSEGILFDARHSLHTLPNPQGVGPLDTKTERVSDLKWSSGLVRKIAITNDYWTVEMAVPFKSIGLASAPAGHRVRFNITSADWDTGEYTCLAPVSNWHDPQQFGGLILGKPRFAVDSLDASGIGTGRNQILMKVRDLTGSGTCRAEISFNCGRNSVVASNDVSVTRTAAADTVAVPFLVKAKEGKWTALVRVLDKNGSTVFAARRNGTIPTPLSVRVASRATFEDRPPVNVSVHIGVGQLSLAGLTLTAELLDAHSKGVKTQVLGRPAAAAFTAVLPVNGLQPGVYKLRLTAVQDGKTLAVSEDTILVSQSPFADAGTSE